MKVAIIMGSNSDYHIVKEAEEMLNKFGVEYETSIVSAHRTPQKMFEFASSAREKFSVIIAAAGGAAHLPGMVASLTSLPVIGLPIKSKSLDGLDSLLSIVQMPAGIPVATVGINQGSNAGILAASIISINDDNIAKKLNEYKAELIAKVEAMELI
jgi:5-(carboxyamino)imidazole ribonucleotide mutase